MSNTTIVPSTAGPGPSGGPGGGGGGGGGGGTEVIQVTNVSPSASSEQMRTLFGFLGKIDELRLFPPEWVSSTITVFANSSPAWAYPHHFLQALVCASLGQAASALGLLLMHRGRARVWGFRRQLASNLGCFFFFFSLNCACVVVLGALKSKTDSILCILYRLISPKKKKKKRLNSLKSNKNFHFCVILILNFINCSLTARYC